MIKKKKNKFYKKAKPKVEKNELPKNSRIITERFVNDHSVFFFGIIIIIVASTVIGYDFYNNFTNQEILKEKRREVITELNFWNNQIISKPNYRDGYFKLALIYYQLGDIHNSRINLDKAMNLDPNFKDGVLLSNILEEE